MEINTNKISACILDMDGVVTQTARTHAAAWKRMFDEFLEKYSEHTGKKEHPFDIQKDYRKYVDGKPRYDGVESFLASRNIALAHGDPEDQPGKETVCGLGNRKNAYFLEIVEKEGVTAYESTVNFIRQGRQAGIRFALISASRNATMVLKSAGLDNLFQVVIDGRTADEIGIAGKPAPDIFLEAAKRLQVDVRQAVVIEDAQAGVEAGKAGGFAMTIGIDRHNQASKLRNAGADLVVSDLAEISFTQKTTDRENHDLPSALEEKEALFKRLYEGTPAIFLDYDGTLTEIVADPAEARLDKRARQTLQRLGHYMFLAVISGRGLEDIRKMVGIDGPVYAGSHGFEVSDGRGYFDGKEQKKKYLSALEKAEEELLSFSGNFPGVHIERKPFAVAVHYRNAEETNLSDLEEKVDDLAERFDELKKTSGKKIFELRPAVNWDKGKALQGMLEKFHIDCSRITPLYIGDDATDEDAFQAIAENGIGILVSERPGKTAARYVLRDPSEVTLFLEKLAEIAAMEMGWKSWKLSYDTFEPEKEKLRETLCTLGNGYFASRGAAAEATAGSGHYPGTYMAGCYNRLQSSVDGKIIENESLVNVPNWLPVIFRLEKGDWFEICFEDFADYHQELDMACGLLTRTIRFIDSQAREIHVAERRLVSMDAPHLGGLEIEITLMNWSGTLYVRSALEGRVGNTQVDRYQDLNNDHLEIVSQGISNDEEIMGLQVRTSQSHILIAEAGRTRFFLGAEKLDPDRRTIEEPGYIAQEAAVSVKAGKPLRIEKIVSLYNSRDRAISECLEDAQLEVSHAPDFSSLLEKHCRAWQHLWQRCGIDIQAPSARISQILNLHIFHLLQTVSVHSIDLDVGIPPRGLHGEAYRGLIMWDELFVFPFLNFRIPDLTRSLLQYRYRRLPQAKRAAKQAGFAGAMFPWQSGSNGREEAQSLHLNPDSGHWIEDNTHLQRHINIAVAYNVWLYYQVSGDIDFMAFYGAEMIIETARFWASLARYNESLDRYEIKGVVGPDEFHTSYPDAAEPGLDNNAYTNIMVAWLFHRALDILELLTAKKPQSVWENLSIEEKEVKLWRNLSRKMRIVFHDNGIISQFEGYDGLDEFDFESYRKKYGNIHRLDRILESEGDSPNRYKIAKQADVLMLFYLLSADELGELFKRLGYPFDHETIPRNIDYYIKRTSHGSTLSRVVHAWVLSRSQREQSWHLFCDALKSDVSDIQGGTTHEGIHLGAMAGTVDLMQRCYTGLETREGILWFNPFIPTEVDELAFNILYRQHWLRVTIQSKSMTVASRGQAPEAIKIGVRDSIRELEPGQTMEFDL